MLSTSLVALEELVCGAHLAYPEGGLLYTYTEAANQAHFRMPLAAASALSSLERKVFSRFLQASQGDYTETEPSRAFVAVESDLMNALRADTGFDEVSCTHEDGGTDMRFQVFMARRSDNRYFSLDLWWSID